MASKKLPAKPTMAQAFQAAQGPAVARPNGRGNGQGPAVARPKDKGIVGEGKDVLKAMGNQVKQDAEFVGAVGKGAVKGAKAVAKGAEKVAGKVANVTVGDVASAPLDVAKNVAKGVKDFFTLNPISKTSMPKNSGVRAAGIMGAKVAAKAKDAKANKARQATDAKYDKVSGTPKSKQMDPGMYKPKGTPRPKQKDPGMYKPRGKNPGQSGGRPSQRGL
jgi:hypothetical protein